MPGVTTKYSERTFHRKYENTFGPLTPEQFPPIDWANQEEIQMLFPLSKREWLKLTKKERMVAETITIKDFELWTPTKSECCFENTKLVIESGKRCAIYGVNGSGKTLLFHSIANGLIDEFPKHMSVHHMEELPITPEAEKVSVMETVLASHPMRRLLVCMEPLLEKEIVKETDPARQAKLKANLEYIKEEMVLINGYNGQDRASKMLRVLGFDGKGEASPMSSLSGGLRMRVALTSAFFINPDLLLLDEPTNHLDLPSVLWLENKLRGYSGSFLLVTHDRHILENVVTSVMQIEDKKIIRFQSGFAAFEKQREENDKAREHMIKEFMLRNKHIDSFHPMYKRMKGYRDWIERRAARKVALEGKFKFKDPKSLPCPAGMEQKDISLINIQNITFSYDVKAGLPFIFKNPVSYEIKQGTRLGVMGPNGAGKSTFLKLITNKLKPTTGDIAVNKDYTLAYFGQHSTKELNMQDSPLQFMESAFPKAKKADLSRHLEKTSISAEYQDSRMIDLSFSQRSCIIFAKLTFVPPHLLIMDEPTNFLDLNSIDSLIHAANSFTGALITVTHNRDFLKRCSKKFLSIVPGAFVEYETMKAAERGTYSFIGALERGEEVDHQTAIQENRGGGAEHTKEYLAKKAAERQAILDAEKVALAEAARLQAEEDAKLKAKEDAKAKHQASLKKDWAKEDSCWAPVAPGGKWTQCVIVRIMRDDCTVSFNGTNKMVAVKKLRQENPEGSNNPIKAAAGGDKRGGKAGGQGAGRPNGGAARGGRGGARGGRGGRGGARGGRGRGGK